MDDVSNRYRSPQPDQGYTSPVQRFEFPKDLTVEAQLAAIGNSHRIQGKSRSPRRFSSNKIFKVS